MKPREIVCADLRVAIDDLRARGFRLDLIYPADEPHTAQLSKAEEEIRVTSRPAAPELADSLPPFRSEFVVTRAGSSAAPGRAGMMYRDLIPGRLGGRYIASHIGIFDGGPVDDWVHFHRIRLQLIVVRRGWARVAYEGQGDPIVMRPGDMVVQPPGIRHRVLESSAKLEVVEITAPALHATFSDHILDLPSHDERDRLFEGQSFVHHIASETPWTDFRDGEAQESRLNHATGSIAQARIVRPGATSIDFAAHEGELVFGFLLEGSAILDFRGERNLAETDAFVIPPSESWQLKGASADLRLLHVTTARLD